LQGYWLGKTGSIEVSGSIPPSSTIFIRDLREIGVLFFRPNIVWARLTHSGYYFHFLRTMWGKATSHALFLGRIRLNCVARIDATSLMVMAIKVSAAPAATQWRVCCALLVTLFILGCGGTAASETAPTGLQVVPMVIPLVALNRPVWGATTADFNNDGYLDLFLE
jgi:hypothetical protein